MDREAIGDLLYFIADTAAHPLVDDFEVVCVGGSRLLPFKRAVRESFCALSGARGDAATAMSDAEFADALGMSCDQARPLFDVMSEGSRQLDCDAYCEFLARADRATLRAYFACFPSLRALRITQLADHFDRAQPVPNPAKTPRALLACARAEIVRARARCLACVHCDGLWG